VSAIAIRVPTGTARAELRAVRVMWERELVRFASDRLRMITSLVQPLLFLFVLGTGLSSISTLRTSEVSLRTFLYPGILAMAVLLTAMFSAASIVWDREFGFLREMLVAPVRRSSLVLGKCLGGATVASFQGVIVIALGGLVDVPYAPSLIIEVFAMQVLLAFTLTAFGVLVAARIQQVQSYMALTQMLVIPLFFISGALFPVNGLPTWLTVANRIDPLTYAVEPIRHAVFAHLDLSAATRARIDPGITWLGWPVPTLLCAAVVAAIGALAVSLAIVQFSRED
jgi:ABC-2 type transport system permease protein